MFSFDGSFIVSVFVMTIKLKFCSLPVNVINKNKFPRENGLLLKWKHTSNIFFYKRSMPYRKAKRSKSHPSYPPKTTTINMLVGFQHFKIHIFTNKFSAEIDSSFIFVY